MRNTKVLAFILVSLLCLGVTWYRQSPKMFDKYAYIGDLRANIYWMERSRNPQLFHDDLLADFHSDFANPFLIWLYRVTNFIDVKLLSELLAFPLCWMAVFFLFRLTYAIKGPFCAFAASLLFILYVWHEIAFDYFGVGNAGDFAFPLLTAFVYYFYFKNIPAMTIVLILQAFFYPPILLICLFCYIVSIFKDFQWKKLMVFLFIGAVSIPILFLGKEIQTEKFGETYNLYQIKQMAEFKDDGLTRGRVPLFYTNIFKQIFNNRSGVGELDGSLGRLLILFSCILIFYVLMVKKLPQAPPLIKILFFVSISLFGVANVLMLQLFEPSRYMLFTLPLILILLTSQMIAEIASNISSQRLRTILLIVLVFLAFILFPVQHKYGRTHNGALFQFIASLPQDSLIAGDPFIMDEVPLFSKRKVYVNSESSVPYFKKYNQTIQRRTLELFDAYYSRSFDDFLLFTKRNEIDYFVARKKDFLQFYLSQAQSYMQPYHSYIEKLIARGGPFALQKVPAAYIIYEDSQFFVIKTKKEAINGPVS